MKDTDADAAILVVDDDIDECRNLADILGDLGYHVDMATEGPSGLALMLRRAYDLALLDWKMPGMDGLTLCREMRRLRPATVPILITGYPQDINPADAQAAGIRRVYAKPVDCSRLLAGVNELLADR